MKTNKLQLLTVLGAATMTTAPLSAGELTGSISLDLNSHFISYGLDVWGAGDNFSDEITFNPAVSFNYQVNEKLSFNAGAWLDVNDNVPGSDFDSQETDTWVGVAYTTGIATLSATFQNWQYAGDSEELLDIGLALDTFLSPSIMFHNRLDAGASGGEEGTFLVLGVEHSFKVNECFSITVPVAVGFGLTDFHTSETGYGYASIGLQGSYAIYDSTSLNFGVTYYDTDDDVVGNADSSFFTYNAGISFSF